MCEVVLPPRKPKSPPRVGIGAFAPPTPEQSRDDERAFDAIGSRKGGESFGTEVPRYRSNGTRSEPRFRGRDGADVRQTTVHLPRDLLRRIAVHCAEHETTFSAVTERMWEAFLEGAGRRAG